MNKMFQCRSGMEAVGKLAAAIGDCVVFIPHHIYRKQSKKQIDAPFAEVRYAMCDAYTLLRENKVKLERLFLAQQEMIGPVPCIPEDPFGPREMLNIVVLLPDDVSRIRNGSAAKNPLSDGWRQTGMCFPSLPFQAFSLYGPARWSGTRCVAHFFYS